MALIRKVWLDDNDEAINKYALELLCHQYQAALASAENATDKGHYQMKLNQVGDLINRIWPGEKKELSPF